MTLISVIIPVFNTERFLVECINSVLRAGNGVIEVICVNDGSSDNSQSILEEFQKENNGVKVITQTNQGVSVARNKGIEAATGLYVTFTDADDMVKEDCFLHIQKSNKNLDAYFSSQFFNGDLLNGSPITDFDRSLITNKVIPSYLQNEFGNSVCGKFYKRSIIAAHSVKFPVGLPLGEDGYFNVGFLKHCNSLEVYQNNSYVYRENTGSATRSLKRHNYLKKFTEDKDRYAHIINDMGYDKNDLDRWSSTKMIKNVMSILSVYFRDSSDVPYSERMKMVKETITDKRVLTALQQYWNEIVPGASRFDLFILNAIRKQSLFKLKWAFKYAHWRNSIK